MKWRAILVAAWRLAVVAAIAGLALTRPDLVGPCADVLRELGADVLNAL